MRTFLCVLLVALVYFSLSHWRVFQANNWNIPGFLMLVGAMPWSGWWFDYMNDVSRSYGWSVRNAVSVVVVPLGFATNCAAVVTGLVWLFRKARRPTAMPPGEPNAS